MMYKVVSYKDKPAVVISQGKEDLPTYIATVMYMIEENNMVQAKMETIYDKTLLSDYKCPHAAETDPARVYCSEGKCTYQLKSPTQLSFICSGCLAESFIFEDTNNNNIEK